MRVLVTGGTGFVGRRLVEQLLARGDDVTVLSRDPTHSTGGLRATRLAAWDPAAARRPASCSRSAMQSSTSWRFDREGALDRVEEEADLREPDRRHASPGRWDPGVHAATEGPSQSGSAIGYYGSRGDERSWMERLPGNGDFLAGVTVMPWEAEAERASGSGVRVALLRTGIVLGPKGGRSAPCFHSSSWVSADASGRESSGCPGSIATTSPDWSCTPSSRAEIAGPVNGTARARSGTESSRGRSGRSQPPHVPSSSGFALKLALGEMARRSWRRAEGRPQARARERLLANTRCWKALREILTTAGGRHPLDRKLVKARIARDAARKRPGAAGARRR
jgi:hypothetical protein